MKNLHPCITRDDMTTLNFQSPGPEPEKMVVQNHSFILRDEEDLKALIQDEKKAIGVELIY